MSYLELNKYFENYIENDISHRAVMLTSNWGQGKTFYIKNKLMNYLHEKGFECVYVSLYGIKELKELNKQLFMEINMCNFSKNSRAKAGFKIIGKTIIKGVASFFGVNIEQSNKDWQKLYDSVNLTGKLIIFDDLERSQIDVREFLGYINNLVEQDGIKVVVVASEQDIYHYEEEIDESGKRKLNYTEETKQYMNIKEKTFGDTILFSCEITQAIEEILKLFKNEKFQEVVNYKSKLIDLDIIQRIEEIFIKQKNFNLRSLLFACQKMTDMLNVLEGKYDLEYLQNIFLGIIVFSLKNKINNNIIWDGGNEVSTKLGSFEFPLYKFAFDFIKYQSLDQEIVKVLENDFCVSIEQVKANDKLKILYNCLTETETNVRDAIFTIKKSLQNEKIIPFSAYLKIINYLVFLDPILDCENDIEEIKSLMILNIQKEQESDKEVKLQFFTGISFETEKQRDKYEEIKKELTEVQNTIYLDSIIDRGNKVGNLCEYIETHNEYFIKKKGFLSNIPIKQLKEAFKNISSADIVKLRGSFQYIYQISNIKEFFVSDIERLEQILNYLKSMQEDINFDKIQKKNLSWFQNDIEKYLEELKDNGNI